MRTASSCGMRTRRLLPSRRCLSTIRIKTPTSRSLAFRLGAAVAFVDDDVAQAEAEAIEELATAFGLSSDESQAILREVVEDLFG